MKQRDNSNSVRHSKSELIECQIATLVLMVENKSGNFANVFNSLHHIIDKKLIERVMPHIARSKFATIFLDSIIKSQAFKSIYYQEVRSSGLTHQKASFNKFYLKYLGPAVNAGKIAATAVLNALTKQPFNFAFGLFLANDYQRRILDFKDCQGFDKAIKDCC